MSLVLAPPGKSPRAAARHRVLDSRSQGQLRDEYIGGVVKQAGLAHFWCPSRLPSNLQPTPTAAAFRKDGHLGGQANITKDQAVAQILLSDFLKVLSRYPEYRKCCSPHRFRPTRMLTGTVVNARAGDALD